MQQKHVKLIALIIIIAMIVTSFSFVMFLPGLFGSSGGVAYGADSNHKNSENIENEMKKLKEYIEYVHDTYKDEVNYSLLFDGAFNGVAEALGDPFSVYYSSLEESQSFKDQVEGSFYGIGVSMENDGGKCKVAYVIKDGPAEKAGIKSGDYITFADGKDVQDMTLSQISGILRGEKGTRVTVTVLRGTQSLTFDLIRAEIHEISVSYTLLEGDMGYIHITGFSKSTEKEFADAVEGLAERGADSFIIDLRGNPGGYVETAINIADQILDKGYITHFRVREEIIKSYSADARESLSYPMAVLINQDTASAAEILAAALSENNRAALVGTGTYGKGIAQYLTPIDEERAIKLSSFYFLTPEKNNIHETGILPDYYVANVTGELSEETKAAYDGFAPMSEQVKPKAGDTGLNVYGAQQRLALLGYGVEATGTMDSATVAAVKKFQREMGMYSYGTLDFTTMNKLEQTAYTKAYGISDEDLQFVKAVEILK